MGTRLWPLSRKKRPKPFLKLVPGRQSLLQETIRRLNPILPSSRIWVIGNQEHLASLKKFSRGVPRTQIIGEPVSRNTLATVGLGASLISRRDPNAFILVLPADHWINDKRNFQRAVKTAVRVSTRTKAFSIFGVRPTFPSSSYGYLKAGKKIARSVYHLDQFIEKPTAACARGFLRTRKFFWHAGIFLAPAKTFLRSMIQYTPQVAFRLSKMSVRQGKVIPPKEFYALPNISIDYAILEQLKNAHLIQCDFDWCDVGTWKSFESLWPRDQFENSMAGSCFALNSRRNIVYSEKKLVCLQGVKDLVVIDTPDALLVSGKDSGEEMRKVVFHLSRKKKTLAKYS